MSRFDGYSPQISLDERVKIMGDEELLDFWEESQYVEEFMQDHFTFIVQPRQGCERLILQELQLRLCQPGLSAKTISMR